MAEVVPVGLVDYMDDGGTRDMLELVLVLVFFPFDMIIILPVRAREMRV